MNFLATRLYFHWFKRHLRHKLLRNKEMLWLFFNKNPSSPARRRHCRDFIMWTSSCAQVKKVFESISKLSTQMVSMNVQTLCKSSRAAVVLFGPKKIHLSKSNKWARRIFSSLQMKEFPLKPPCGLLDRRAAQVPARPPLLWEVLTIKVLQLKH